jgi:hypothetical protein
VRVVVYAGVLSHKCTLDHSLYSKREDYVFDSNEMLQMAELYIGERQDEDRRKKVKMW